MAEKEDKIYNEFCNSKNCPEYIEWSFGQGGVCVSCKKMGQSYDITDYPKDCDFINEIKAWEG